MQKPAWRDLETARSMQSGEAAASLGWGPFILLLFLIIALTAGFIVYAVITSGEINDLSSDVKKLKQTLASSASPSTRSALRMETLLQRQDATALTPPKLTAPSKAPVAERPAWATDLKPRWLQFESPLTDAAMRLPPEGGHKGLSAADTNGYKIECKFGDSIMQPTRDQVDLLFATNDETGDEYAILRVLGPAFRGRQCALEWMA